MPWPPPGWSLTRPPLNELIPFFAGTPAGSPPGTTGFFQEMMTILGGSPGAAQGILGTLSPLGVTTTGWRINQVGDISIITQNAYATALMATPATPTLTPSTTGGFLASITLFVKVTALDGIGETLPSAEASATITGPTGSCLVAGYAVTGAAQYRIYVGTSSGNEINFFPTTATTFTITVLSGASPFFQSGSPAAATTAASWTADDSSKQAFAIALRTGILELRMLAAPAVSPLVWICGVVITPGYTFQPGTYYGSGPVDVGQVINPWRSGYFSGTVQGGSNSQVAVAPAFL